MPSLKRFLKMLNTANEKAPTDTVKSESVGDTETVTSSKIEQVSTKLKSIFGSFSSSELTIEDHKEKIRNMTKLELDQYAEKYDIYLDRRRTKENMIKEFIEKLKDKK